MKALTAAGYTALRNKVRETLLLGQQKIEEARVRTYWETGRLINEHVLAHKGRADYGKQVIFKLAEDLEVGDDLLYRVCHFHQAFPNSASWRKLSWSHCRAIMRLPDRKKRLEFIRKAETEEWTAEELESVLRETGPFQPRSLKLVQAAELLVPKRGMPFTYRILDPKTVQPKEPGLLLIDLGFSSYRDLDAVTSKSFKPLDIVESVKTGDDSYTLKSFLPPNSQLKSQDSLYTYRATIEKIVDGDTLRVVVDLGFNTRTRQYLRLRGLDCPEIDTPEGRAAAEFVKAKIKTTDAIIFTSSKSDKYDRYLADVFYNDKNGEEQYLNNLLLGQGHAVRMGE
jgi:endonuclease YncB( thermonuclease family)